jgi:23S rRNA (adenine2503-C2)-methyltransferase
LHPEIKHAERINLHYARLGEPLFNYDVIKSAYYLAGMFKAKDWGFHPVISTIIPNTMTPEKCIEYIAEWLRLKHDLGGDAGLQLSINTTDEMVRMEIMPNSHSPRNIAYIVDTAISKVKFLGRKIALNFAVTDAVIDAEKISRYFDPAYYMCKLTPMHSTDSCRENNLLTKDGYAKYYPYKKAEEDLKAQGFDVIVFIPSKEEDESMITCGNAILKECN